MRQMLSALDVAQAAGWFAEALAYPKAGTPPAESAGHVERWIDNPGTLLETRDRVEYTSLFDIGNPAPPAPLMESHYQQDRQARLRQVVTFYRTYGVINETEFSPDHLCVELSFLSFLASLACDYPERDDLTKAYRFFSKVHLGSWVGSVVQVLENEAPDSMWVVLLKALAQFLDEVIADLELSFEVEDAV